VVTKILGWYDRRQGSGSANYDDYGIVAEVELRDRTYEDLGTFTPSNGEEEEVLIDRVFATVGSPEHRIVIQVVKPGPNGGLAPGFERFAKA
jgi:hypothetical protein